MNESIYEELLAENAKLREELSKDNLVYKIYVLDAEPLKISGIVISEGVWKGVLYPYNELVKSIDKIKKLPILVQHGKTKEFSNKQVGKIVEVKPIDMIKAIAFEGIITDEEAKKLVVEGQLDAVSIKGEFKKLDTKHIPAIGKDYNPIEVSLTPSPACNTCLIFNIEELNKKILNTSLSKEKVGEYSMEDTKIEQFELKDNEVLVLPNNFEELEDGTEIELEIMDQVEALKAKRGIIKVPFGKYPKIARKIIKYYGYPYPYYAYPYYYYYGYYPYYGYPYYYIEKVDWAQLVDMLVTDEDYRKKVLQCIKKKPIGICMLQSLKEGVKAKSTDVESTETIEEDTTELAKITCPVCKATFDTKKAFIQHWSTEHEEKYGAFKLVKKLIKKVSENIRVWKKILELEEDVESTEPSKVEEGKETKTEEKEEVTETKESTETKQEEVKEAKEPTVSETPSEQPTESKPSIDIKKLATPEICAELILKSKEE